MNDEIKKLLLPYQINNTENLIRIVKNKKIVIDSSDTGTGKTYCTIATCKILNKKPFIICPKSVINPWKQVCKLFNVIPYGIVNYETIKNLKKYDEYGKRTEIDILKKKDDSFVWKNIPDDFIFIFDEVHRCNELSSINSKLLISAKHSGFPIIMLSATLGDKPDKLKIFMYMVDFIDPKIIEENNYNMEQIFFIFDRWIKQRKHPMVQIHEMLYPNRATRMRIEALGDAFPETQIIAQAYSIDKKREDEIQQQYIEISRLLDKIKEKTKEKINNKKQETIFVKILRARQKIELLKIPTFVDLTRDFIENNFSVVIFVNFTDTLKSLMDMLHTNCVIYGEQTDIQRQKNIDNFQNDKERIIICNIKAGGVGLSLHDINGIHPRVSLISPSWSSVDLTQALGRIHRANAKSKSLQRIIYTANTIEEQISNKLQEKINNLNSLNNGDLDLTNIIIERRQEKL